MPLPEHALTIEGGCNCGAIRYRVSIPPEDDRPIYPGHGDAVEPPVKMPLSCTDHCNDCRAATGAILPCWLLTPMDMVQVSIISTQGWLNNGCIFKNVERAPWHPAAKIFCAEEAPAGFSLAFFASTKGRRRSFCSRCGTVISYQVFPKIGLMEFDMLDIALGTIDKELLESIDLRPERQLWWKKGIPWIQELSVSGLGEKVPRHKVWSVAKQIADESDGKEDSTPQADSEVTGL